MNAAPRRALAAGRVAEAGLVTGVAGLLVWAVFAGGGSSDDALATVGIAAIACAALGLGLALAGVVALPRLERPGVLVVAGTAALTAWAGISIAWSIAGDRSWGWLARGLVYLAFLVLGALCGARARGARRVAMLVAAVIAAALAWALLGVAVPRFFEDGDRIARLREPVDYWNALAVLADAALAFGLWLARGRALPTRAAGALLTYGATVVLLLTQSRAGVVGAAAVLVVWLVLTDDRLADALRACLLVAPGLLVGGWAFTRPALVEDGALRADRVGDGRWFALLFVLGALVVSFVAAAAPIARLVTDQGRLVRTTILRLCALGALAGALALVAAVGNPFSWASSQLSGGECVNDPGRLTDLCANNRLAWWEEAVDIAADHPLGGSGAGTFELARRRYRDDATTVSEPHSVPLQLLADTGIIGLGLGLLVAAAAAVGVRRALGRLDRADRPAGLALVCLLVAYGVHALVDYDLDFVAVTAPLLVALGALLAAGLGRSTRRVGASGLVALGATAAAAVLAVALPALAERDVDRAVDAADVGDVAKAVDAADRARLLDPLSPSPLAALAVAANAAGDTRAAVAWYEKAVDLQPENPDTWYELGLDHAIWTGDQCAAYQAFNESYTLDPKSRRWSPGGPFDVAKDAVNNGACE